MKCEIKCTYLCQGVFKWSQEAIKKVDLVHSLSQSHHELSQTTNTQRTLQEDLKRHSNALLPPSGNSLSKSLEGKITNTNLPLFPLKAADLLPTRYCLGCCLKLCVPNGNSLISNKHCLS